MTSDAPAWSAAWNCFPTFSALSEKSTRKPSPRSCCTRVRASGRRSSCDHDKDISSVPLRDPALHPAASVRSIINQVREDDIAHTKSEGGQGNLAVTHYREQLIIAAAA